MNRKLCMALLCLIFATICRGQQIYFSKINIADSAAVTKQMSVLASEIISRYKPSADNLFRLQIVAADYAGATTGINMLRETSKTGGTQYPALLYAQYALFCRAKIEQQKSGGAFNDAFTSQFDNLFKGLDDKSALYISTAFLTRNGIDELKQNFKKALEKATQKDSLSVDDAIALCRSYNLANVFKNIEPIAIKLLKADENRRYIIQDSVLIKTRDGAYISAIVVRKRGATTPQPTILQFSIYTGAIGDITKDAVAHGYVAMIAFTRGKRFSPDKITPYEYDGGDCYDVIDWISRQAWSNGKVGMYGGSYGGFTQWAAAKHLHPALKTIVPSASAAPGLDVPMMNNVFENFVFPWIYYVGNNKFLDYADYNNTAKWDSINAKWYARGLPYHSLDSLTGRGTNRVFQGWIAHPGYDGYWQNMIPYKQDFAQINIPVLTTTGYYDGGQVGAMYYFREHYKYNKSANHYLLIGPYSHYGSQGFVSIPDPEPVIGGYKIDQEANIHIHEIIFQWFDYILKDGKKPAILQDKVNYQVMGGNEWKHVPTLSKISNDTLKFYLTDQHVDHDYRLSTAKPSQKGAVQQIVNFADRKTANNFYRADTVIYNKLDKAHGIAFVSDAITQPTTIAGCFTGVIKAVTNKKDFDYNLTLYELMPDGKYFYLSYFMGRASYAADNNRRRLLKPGEPATILFTNSYMTGKKISAGSRIVVVLNIGKNQDNQINYGTGKNVSDETINDAAGPLKISWSNESIINIPVLH